MTLSLTDAAWPFEALARGSSMPGEPEVVAHLVFDKARCFATNDSFSWQDYPSCQVVELVTQESCLSSSALLDEALLACSIALGESAPCEISAGLIAPASVAKLVIQGEDCFASNDPSEWADYPLECLSDLVTLPSYRESISSIAQSLSDRALRLRALPASSMKRQAELALSRCSGLL